MFNNFPSIPDQEIKEFKDTEEERGRYPTEAEEFGGVGGEEYFTFSIDEDTIEEKILELKDALEEYNALLEESASEEDLRTYSGDILQKYEEIKNALVELETSHSEADREIAESFKVDLEEIEVKMEELGI